MPRKTASSAPQEDSVSAPIELDSAALRVDLDPIDLSAALRNIESAPIGVVEEDAPRPQGGGAQLAQGGRFVDPQVRAAMTRPLASASALAVTRPVPSAEATAGSDVIAKPLPEDLAVTRRVPIGTAALDDNHPQAPIPAPPPVETSSTELETVLSDAEPRSRASRRWLPAVAGLAIAAAVASVWILRGPDDTTVPEASAAAPMTAAAMVPPPRAASPQAESIPAATLAAKREPGEAGEVAEAPGVGAAAEPPAPADEAAPDAEPAAGGASDADPAAGSAAAAPEPAAEAQPAPEEAAPAADADPDDLDAEEPGEDGAVSPALRAAYDDAVRTYEETRSQEALARVASSACAMNDHPAAYAAFRKLVGKDLRSTVVIRCRDVGIDVTVAAHRRSPEELVVMADEALANGEPQRAYKMARVSNRRRRSPEAIVMMGRAACALGNPTEARSLLRHLQAEERTALTEGCKTAGIDL